MKEHRQEKLITAAGFLGLSVASAAKFYAVREVAAALAIFALVFFAVGAFILILFLLDALAAQGLSRVEARFRLRARTAAFFEKQTYPFR
jgi:hypothetical protein